LIYLWFLESADCRDPKAQAGFFPGPASKQVCYPVDGKPFFTPEL
jgi:hypothetical protein